MVKFESLELKVLTSTTVQVRSLHFDRAVIQCNRVFCNCVTDEVKVYINVLSVCMELVVCRECDSGLIVTEVLCPGC